MLFRKTLALLFLINLLASSYLFANDENEYASTDFLNFRFEIDYEFDLYSFNSNFLVSSELPNEKSENAKLVRFRKNIFSIHAGYSPYHGFLGVEYQWQFLSLNIGITDKLSGGIKFYSRRGLENSFYWGGFGTSFDKYSVFGTSIGYRWIKKSGLTINLGIATGILIKEDSNSDTSTPMILPTLTIGWSF